jgi:hypothetical protein
MAASFADLLSADGDDGGGRRSSVGASRCVREENKKRERDALPATSKV